MSKKKTETEMRAIAEMIKNMVKDWNEDEEKEPDPCENCEVHYCNDCPHWHDDDDETEEEDEDREEDENEYYKHNECEDHDGYCEDCSYYNEDDCCCELDNEDEEAEDEEENTQIEDLSKFITSVGTVLGGDMGLLVFDKSNKKDMEKLAAIFGEYAKRL